MSGASDTHWREVAPADTTFCPNCGERISARARFCPSCGARQEDYQVAPASGLWARDEPPASAPPPTPPEEPPPPPEPPPREPLTERIGRVDPQAGELSGILRDRLTLPGMIGAGVASLIAAGIVLAAGVLLAVITPDNSILGVMGRDAGVVTEAFRQAVGTLLAPVVDTGPLLIGSRRLDPLILAAVPIGAVAFATRSQLARTEGAKPLVRLGWATVVAVPFALLMLVFAVIGGSTGATGISPDAGGAFGLGLLWGIVGAVLGAAPRLPLRGDAPPAGLGGRALAAAAAALRPLVAVLAVCTVLGLAGWLVQVGRGVDDVRAGRSAPTAVIEEAAFLGEHGVHLAALAGGARFEADTTGALGLPFPVDRADEVPGRDGGLRIFSYGDVLPAYVVLPALVILLGTTALGALYAGFAAARAARPGSLGAAAAWGAITGPTWALTMSILTALAGGLFHGDADGGSVFGVLLLGGLVLGAAGGALAEGSASAAADPS